MPAHILIVDDDNRILELLKRFFEGHNFLISTAIDTVEAEKLMKYFGFDLIILDVMLPGVSGLEFVKIIKSTGSAVPIIMLTALSEAEDRVKGLEIGASDYLTKPFAPKELLLRVKNLIDNHNQYKKEKRIERFGNNYYDYTSKEFIKKNQAIQLSSTEQKLLEILIEGNGQPIAREELASRMGGLNMRSIDVQIVRIRNKIEEDSKSPQYLKTVRNKGYALYT